MNTKARCAPAARRCIPKLSLLSPGSAGFQPAACLPCSAWRRQVSRISNRLIPRQSSGLPTGSRRHSRLEICATNCGCRQLLAALAALWALIFFAGCLTKPIQQVGPLTSGGHLVATHQLLHPAGQSVEFGGRPIDLALSPDGRTLFVKDNRGLVVIDAGAWKVRQELKLSEGGGSTHGLALTRDGSRLYVSTAQNALWEALVAADGTASWGRKIALPGPGGTGNSHAAGIALSSDGATAYVCLSRNNSLGVVDLASAKLLREIPVGVAPFDVVLVEGSDGGKRAYISNWGGRHPRAGDPTAQSAGTDTHAQDGLLRSGGELTAKSAGTDAVVDARGVAASGTVSVVDLGTGRELAQIPTGLHPSDLELSADQRTLFVANANSDSVSVIDLPAQMVIDTILVRPDSALPFGSAPNALTLSQDGAKLYVANGGNNAVAVVDVGNRSKHSLEGFIPTAWYPGALAADGKHLYIANVKGLGSRHKAPNKKGWNSHNHLGTVSKVELPSAALLAGHTQRVKADARVPEILRALEKTNPSRRPVPVPKRLGDPSVFEHVVYIIKENRTYDQVFGGLQQGNGDPSLCVFGREVTPNQHALAEQFVLLDNYYCNGVLSADGHAWAMEGYVTDYLEKSFGGFTRSYPFSGDDPLSYSAAGFIWDNVLSHGLSFRNYGEMSKTATVPANATFKAVFDDYQAKAGKITFEHDIQIETLRRYSCPRSPGWNMRIPDQIRADVFLAEFREHEQQGHWPNLIIIFLPSDHTSGTRPGNPTPRAQVADNDLAVGRIVEAVSQSRFWPKTCIFVIEDDPQAGYDHVDGHRSTCLIVSPYTKRGEVISHFYNQTSVLHTMEQMLGLPPMNQMDALAPLMTQCFTSRLNFSPYTCLPNQIPLDEMNKPLSELEGQEHYWATRSLEQSFEEVDQADEDVLNRIIWYSVKGTDTPYPAHWAGAHGKGLKGLRLKLVPDADD
ncbi:MAG: bifunctional YncE family protein/alkaline phosphatase family protein [Chloroflexi bacterium]|nr:bifunctional YncE family protein/alkaline phosphatase family protein [Chloroflexota bacterium]